MGPIHRFKSRGQTEAGVKTSRSQLGSTGGPICKSRDPAGSGKAQEREPEGSLWESVQLSYGGVSLHLVY